MTRIKFLVYNKFIEIFLIFGIKLLEEKERLIGHDN